MRQRVLEAPKLATADEELGYLQRAFDDYKNSLGESEEVKERLFTNKGFCEYFSKRHNIEFDTLTTIFSMYLDESSPIKYWFTEGSIELRLEKLLRAIEKLEQETNEIYGQII